jgi:signal transduction histidine kinase
MDKWIITYKALTLLYCISCYIAEAKNDYTEAVLTILFIVCVNTALYLFTNFKSKLAILVLSVILEIGTAYFVNMSFLLLLPMSLYELSYHLKLSIFVGAAVSMTILPLISGKSTFLFLLVAAFGLLFFNLLTKTYVKILSLNEENDSLREMNYNLNININREAEYIRQMKYTTGLEERNKISQEIHDKVGHTISGSLMQLEAAKLLIKKDPDKAEYIVRNIIAVLRSGMETIRATLRNIKPQSEQIGINRIKLLADEFEAGHNIKVNLVYKGDLSKISYGYWKVIYDNVFEAMTNTLKYARATTITISIEVLNKLVKVEIKDNGAGAFKVNKGLGLRGIEERCENIGGKVIIDGSKGFSIIVLLPL